jgi:hypothetical protein
MGVPPAWESDEVLTTSRYKNWPFYDKDNVPRTWTEYLVRPKHCKKNLKFGTWNVRRLHRAGSPTTRNQQGINWI